MLGEEWVDGALRTSAYLFIGVLALCVIIGSVYIVLDYMDEAKRHKEREDERLKREWWKK